MNTRLYSLLLIAVFGLSISSCQKKDIATTEVTIFDDEFDNNANNWAFNDPANGASVIISGGYLNYSYHPAKSGTQTVAVNTSLQGDRDFDIITDIASNNAMALAFGVSPTDNGYSFYVDNLGQYAVYDEGTTSIQPTAIIGWTQATKTTTGVYKLELQQTSGFWYGYINNQQVFKIAAHPLYGQQVGFAVLDGTDGNADYLTVQQ